jgi:uncharacterized membrane protein
MTNWKRRLTFNFALRLLLKYFFQGLVVIVPVGISIYAVVWLFNAVDSILPNIINSLFPGWHEPGTTNLKHIPGLGFVVVIVFVVVIGSISSSFIVSKIIDFFDAILERTPGVKFIYSSVKDFLEAFAGNKKKFNKPVLASVDAPGVWRLGFITQEDATHFGLVNHVVVYVPLSYAITGIMYIVPKDNIKPLENINSAEAMKFAVSGGVTEVE